ALARLNKPRRLLLEFKRVTSPLRLRHLRYPFALEQLAKGYVLRGQGQAALSVLQVSGFDVLVGWRQDAVRFGMDLTVISELAKIIAATAPSDGHRHLRGVEIYKYSPEVARQVDYFRVRRCSSATLAVHSSCLFWAPKDGSWVEEAVAKKAQTYDVALCARFLLVIDGLCHLDGEQMTAYRAATPADSISFAEVWAVTMGRAYRLKP
ncbi:MAG TPA: hypothetical protein VII95_06255, partial [Terriglobales bacterium]